MHKRTQGTHKFWATTYTSKRCSCARSIGMRLQNASLEGYHCIQKQSKRAGLVVPQARTWFAEVVMVLNKHRMNERVIQVDFAFLAFGA